GKGDGMHEGPLEGCGADSQGAIGYTHQQPLQNELRRRGINKPVAPGVTQIAVDPDASTATWVTTVATDLLIPRRRSSFCRVCWRA
ncbi:MAG: hypothetical protein D8M55_12675, partial [Chloroflexi bacterium]|nr:hypothetical protein [Chloroflexota bacterium]